MKTELFQIDLSEGLTPLPVSQGYDYYLILLRFQKQPVGWISLPAVKSGYISVEQLQKSIQEQQHWEVTQQLLAADLGFQKSSRPFDTAISVVVCTRNRTGELASCLQSLLALEYSNFEIIVVDNAPSNNDTFELVAHLPIRYIREDRPGLDWARNRGIMEAQHDIVAFTDDDVLVDRFWLQAISKAFRNEEVMAVTGHVVPAELETPPQHTFEFVYGGMGHGFRRRVISRNALSDRQLLWASNFGVGANMAFRRSVFERIGMFDIALDVGTPSCGCGDVEMFHRLIAKGNLLVYEPAMLVWHKHRRTFEALKKQIADNGKSFGCYLITCFKNRSVKRTAVIKFFLIDWLYTWNLRNLIKTPKKLPRSLSFTELMGMLKSPMAYRASKAYARRISKNTAPGNVAELAT